MKRVDKNEVKRMIALYSRAIKMNSARLTELKRATALLIKEDVKIKDNIIRNENHIKDLYKSYNKSLITDYQKRQATFEQLGDIEHENKRLNFLRKSNLAKQEKLIEQVFFVKNKIERLELVLVNFISVKNVISDERYLEPWLLQYTRKRNVVC